MATAPPNGIRKVESDDWEEKTDPEQPAQVTNAAVLRAIGKLEGTMDRMGDRVVAAVASLRKLIVWALVGVAGLLVGAGLVAGLLWWLHAS